MLFRKFYSVDAGALLNDLGDLMKEKKMSIPDGKRYGQFNGRDLHLYGEHDLVKEYALTFEEMPDAFKSGIGVFQLPNEWIKNKKAEWRQSSKGGTMCYYY